MPQRPTVGEQISAARKGAGYTQKALAERLGVTVAMLRTWENGHSEPDADMRASIADVLDSFEMSEAEDLSKRLSTLTKKFDSMGYITAQDLAEKAGVHINTVNNVLGGKTNPQKKTLSGLENAMVTLTGDSDKRLDYLKQNFDAMGYITAQDLAEKAGVHINTVNNVLGGKTKPIEKTLSALENAMETLTGDTVERLGYLKQKFDSVEYVTAQDLAEKAGVHINTVNNVLGGKTNPWEKTLSRLENAMETLTGDIVERLGYLKQKFDSMEYVTAKDLANESGMHINTVNNVLGGKTNPWEKTLSVLENAIETLKTSYEESDESVAGETEDSGRSDISDDLHEAVEDTGEYIFEPFDPQNREAIRRLDFPGIYILYGGHAMEFRQGDAKQVISLFNGSPEYVGQSKNIRTRIGSHEEKWWYRGVAGGVYIKLQDDHARASLEKILIALLNPQFNDRDNPRAKVRHRGSAERGG